MTDDFFLSQIEVRSRRILQMRLGIHPQVVATTDRVAAEHRDEHRAWSRVVLLGTQRQSNRKLHEMLSR